MQTPIELEIVKGVEKAVNDEHSAESALNRINLLSSSGLALDTDGWQLAFPSLKNQGLWADSPSMQGRNLISSAQTNVIETMQLSMSNTDLAQRQAIISHLFRLQNDARNFWSSETQVEPVFLNFRASETKANQYALIYTFDVAMDTDPYDCTSTWQVTLTIEREPFWRIAVPPGGNPLLYHFWKSGKVPGVDYSYADMSIFENTDHFHYEAIENRHEWDNTDYLTTLSKNYIDIDAADIPGDAPALVCLAVTATGSSMQINVAQMVNPVVLYDRDGDQINQTCVLNAGDCDTGVLITKSIDACGVYSNNSIANQYIGTYSIAGSTTISGLLSWSRMNGATGTRVFELTLNRGTYAAFLRCKQTSGSYNDVFVRLRITEGAGAYEAFLDYQPMPIIAAAAGCNKRFDALYLGQFKIPLGVRAPVSLDGRGLAVGDRESGGGNVLIRIDAYNSNGSSRTLEFLDLILMPIDVAYAECLELLGITLKCAVFDNTGYLTHGENADVVISGDDLSTPPDYQIEQHALELRGHVPQLIPQQHNRLYFFNRLADGSYVFYSSAAATYDMTIRLNIVPRCMGITDVEQDS